MTGAWHPSPIAVSVIRARNESSHSDDCLTSLVGIAHGVIVIVSSLGTQADEIASRHKSKFSGSSGGLHQVDVRVSLGSSRYCVPFILIARAEKVMMPAIERMVRNIEKSEAVFVPGVSITCDA